MPNTTVFKSSGTCTDSTIPKLYRDPAASAGSLFCYDALDLYSWPSQTSPPGAATLVDLLDIASAPISAVPISFAAGFLFTSNSDERITLPASSKLASNAANFGITWWVKPTTIVGSAKGIAGIGDGYNFANAQYALYRDTNNFKIISQGVSVGNAPVNPGVVTQLGFTLTLANGVYTRSFWQDNVAVATNTAAAPMTMPTDAAATIGNLSDIFGGNGDDFTFYRCHADSLNTRTAASFIAADYAAGVGRFA